jgi:hypothetical protein
MKDLTKLKEEWQVHNRDHGLSWNEIAEMFNQIESLYKEDAEKRLLDYTKWLMDVWNPNQLHIPFSVDAPKAFLSGHKPKEEHGICKESNCKKPATKDYNGHNHWVCDYHYETLTKYFEDNYD